MAVVNFQGALATYLAADTTLAALIGSKLYSPPAPQNTAAPYATLQKIGKMETIDTLNGFSSVVRERWQLDAYGSTIDSAEAVAKAIFDRLHMKSDTTWSNYKIYLSKFDNENVFDDSDDNGSEEMTHRIQQDFLIKRSYNTI